MQLATTAEDNRQARDALLGLLPGQRRWLGGAHGSWPRWSAGWCSLPRRTRTSARPATRCSGCWSQADGWVADELVTGVSLLSPTAQDKRQARGALLGLLPSQSDDGEAAWLVGRAVRLATTDEEKRETRDKLIGLLPSQADGWLADEIRAWPAALGPAAGRRHQASQLDCCPSQAGAPTADEPASRGELARPGREDDHAVRSTLLRSLTGETDARAAAGLAAGMIYAGPT